MKDSVSFQPKHRWCKINADPDDKVLGTKLCAHSSDICIFLHYTYRKWVSFVSPINPDCTICFLHRSYAGSSTPATIAAL